MLSTHAPANSLSYFSKKKTCERHLALTLPLSNFNPFSQPNKLYPGTTTHTILLIQPTYIPTPTFPSPPPRRNRKPRAPSSPFDLSASSLPRTPIPTPMYTPLHARAHVGWYRRGAVTPPIAIAAPLYLHERARARTSARVRACAFRAIGMQAGPTSICVCVPRVFGIQILGVEVGRWLLKGRENVCSNFGIARWHDFFVLVWYICFYINIVSIIVLNIEARQYNIKINLALVL